MNCEFVPQSYICGKYENTLEALNAIAEANRNYFGLREELPLNYKVHICLEKHDAENLFPDKMLMRKNANLSPAPEKNAK